MEINDSNSSKFSFQWVTLFNFLNSSTHLNTICMLRKLREIYL